MCVCVCVCVGGGGGGGGERNIAMKLEMLIESGKDHHLGRD